MSGLAPSAVAVRPTHAADVAPELPPVAVAPALPPDDVLPAPPPLLVPPVLSLPRPLSPHAKANAAQRAASETRRIPIMASPFSSSVLKPSHARIVARDRKYAANPVRAQTRVTSTTPFTLARARITFLSCVR